MLKFLDISEIKDSTHTINEQQNEKTDQIKNLKNDQKIGIEIFVNDNTKSPEI